MEQEKTRARLFDDEPRARIRQNVCSDREACEDHDRAKSTHNRDRLQIKGGLQKRFEFVAEYVEQNVQSL